VNQVPPTAAGLAGVMADAYISRVFGGAGASAEYRAGLVALLLPGAELIAECYARTAGLEVRVAALQSMVTGLYMRAVFGPDGERDDWPDVPITDEMLERLRADCLRAYRKEASDG
jgi:hypothetical protein